MAMSIKYFSDIPIQLIHDKGIQRLTDWHKKFFDYRTEIDEKDSYIQIKKGKFTELKVYPALAKLKMYDYFQFDETIYLDVDGLCLKELTPLFKQDSYYNAQMMGTGKLQEETWDKMIWAYPKDVAPYIKDKKQTIPFIQSSFQYIRKCTESRNLYNRALKVLAKPIPVESLRYKWARKIKDVTGQPDELCMNIALAQGGLVPDGAGEPVYFNFRSVDSEQYILKNHYVLGLFGNPKQHTHKSVLRYYDMVAHKYSKERHKRHLEFKAYNLMQGKFGS